MVAPQLQLPCAGRQCVCRFSLEPGCEGPSVHAAIANYICSCLSASSLRSAQYGQSSHRHIVPKLHGASNTFFECRSYNLDIGCEATKALLLGGAAGVAGPRAPSTPVGVRLPARCRRIVFNSGRSHRRKVGLSRTIPIVMVGARLLTVRAANNFPCTVRGFREQNGRITAAHRASYDLILVRKSYSAEPPFHPTRFLRLDGRESLETHPLLRMDPLVVDCPNPATPANLPSQRH
jgi:hypothetical protein